MPSIAQLLDCHGLPPRELLRDWAWQIYRTGQSMPAAKTTSSARLPGSPWTAIELAEDGRLNLTSLNRPALDQALSELRSWLTVSTADRLPWATGPLDQAADGSGLLSTDALAATPPGSGADILAPAPSSRRFSSLRRPKSTQPGQKLQRRIQATLGAVAIVVLVALTCTALMRGKSGSPDHPAPAPTATLPTSTEPATTDAIATVGQTTDSSQAQASIAAPASEEPAEIEHLAPLSDGAPAAFDDLIAGPASSIATTAPLAPTLQASPVTPAESTSQEVAGTIDSLQDAANNPADTAPSASSNLAATDQPADVMLQVTEAINQAQSQDETQPPATGLGSESANVVTLLRDRVRTRYQPPRYQESQARISAWTIQVQRPDGFLCQPSQLQTLEPKRPCQWRLVDDSAAAPRVCLVIEAFCRGKRGESIDLCLYGSAEDFPQLKLPLSRPWLDNLLKNLQASQYQLRWMSTALAQSRLASAARAQVAERKRYLAEQLKLCQRLIEIVAQCDRLAGLADGHVSCEVTGVTKTPGSPSP